MSARTTRLLTDWSFTQVGVDEAKKISEWLPVSSFPTTVHVELLKLKKIPDPVSFYSASSEHSLYNLKPPKFVGLHEWDVQCM